MIVKVLVSIVFCLAASALMAERQPYDRYQSIVDRQMFGPLPPGFDPTKNPSEVKKTNAKGEGELTKEQEQVKKAIRFSVINETLEGETAVGFTDSQDPKTPHHYYLKVGETRDGWLVKEADISERTMTIVKDGVEVTLSLGGNSATAAGAVKSVNGASASRDGRLGASGALGSLRGRRLMREQQAKQQQEELQRQREELEKQRAEAQEKEQADKAERAAEREEQRKQLLQIQDQLRKAMEQKKSAQEDSSEQETATPES